MRPIAVQRRSRSRVWLPLLVFLACLCGSGSSPAEAKKLLFGAQDYFTYLQDVPFKNADGESLQLSHKYTFHSFLAPYRMEDGGYVLKIKDRNAYYQLTPEQIADFQAKGMLPKPLPPYEFSTFDYVFGHFLWVVAGIGLLVVAVSAVRKRKRGKAAAVAEAALEQHRQGRLDAAIAGYGEALAIDPRMSAALDLRAQAHLDKGDIDQAIADYSNLIASDGKNLGALFRRGVLLAQKGLHARAIGDLDRVLKQDKSQLVARYHRGIAHAALGDDAKALADFDEVIARDPEAAPPYAQRAEVHQRAGRQDAAASDRRMAAELEARAATVAAQPPAA